MSKVVAGIITMAVIVTFATIFTILVYVGII